MVVVICGDLSYDPGRNGPVSVVVVVVESTPSHDVESYPREKEDSLSEIVLEVGTLPTGATNDHDDEDPEQSGVF